MKFNTLEYFITLSESKSINEAARKLYISQPSLTKALQLLEEEVGTPLFQRSSAGIALTPAGQKMLPEAKQVMEYYRGWKTLAQSSVLQQIDVYSHISFPDFLLPDLLLQFRISHPELTINYKTCVAPEQYLSRNVRQPVLVMTLCTEKDTMKEFTRIQGNKPIVLMDGEYRCLVNPESDLAAKASVLPHDLKNHFLIIPNIGTERSGGFLTDMLQEIALANPHSRSINVESATNVISVVSKNPHTYALSYYPALKRYTGRKLVSIPFEGMQTKGKLCLFYAQEAYNQHPVIQELVDTIEKAGKTFLDGLDRL